MARDPDDIFDDQLRKDIEARAKRLGKTFKQYLRERLGVACSRTVPENPEIIAAQGSAINKLIADLEALPCPASGDSLVASRDHDEILYGTE